MTPVKVSVVMPTYNAAALVETAVASVAAQNFPGLEMILVDDASQDDTVARARESLQRHGLRYQILVQDCNGGPAAARNRGVAAATGEYVAFLDADDAWLPGKLHAQAAMLDDDPAVTLCGCQTIWVDEQDRVVEPLFRNLPSRLPDGWKRLLWQCYVATPCAMVRRMDLGIRPFDPRLRVGEDRDLWIKLASNGVVALVQQEMVRIRLARGSFMDSNRDAVLSTRPMLERHARAFARDLSFRNRILAKASLDSQIGKSLCANPNNHGRAIKYLVRAALLGYRPFDNLRFLILSARSVRALRAFLRHARPAR